MTTRVVVLSKERLFSAAIAEYFRTKGLDVVVSSKESVIGERVAYLVVVNIDGHWTKNSSFRKRVEKYRPRTVILNSASGGVLEVGVSVKQVFVDNVFPLYVKSVQEAARKAKGEAVFLPEQAWVAITTEKALCDKIAEDLFSFRGDSRTLVGKLVSYREIARVVNPLAEVYIDKNAVSRVPRQNLEVLETGVDLYDIVLNCERNVTTEVKRRKTRSFKKPIVIAAACLVIFLSAPYVLLSVSGLSSGIAYKALKNGYVRGAHSALSVASMTSRVSWQLLNAGRIFPFAQLANDMTRATETAGRVLAISDYAREFGSGVFGGKGNAGEVVQKLSVELAALYYDMSFVEGEGGLLRLPYGAIPEAERLLAAREYVLAASKMVRELPLILGFDRPKTYMLLLQNNMELRPTGGFIGSFALLTFSKGELIDNTVYDVYSADGQLKGYIKPPAPIEEHLGEASWTLRDSNWDPHFPTSASRASWFLDKSIDREVDGIIGVNLEVARRFLEVLGPVSISDFGDTVDSKNMYEKVQFEVENDFFPGSRKKAQYLSGLLNAILARLKVMTVKESVELILVTVGSLEARDIQVVLHSPAQGVFSDQGWDGGVELDTCGENCANVFAGLVEANVGVNKANYYIQREVELKTDVGGRTINYEMIVRFRNSALGKERIPEQRYKVYMRALAHPDSMFSEAFEVSSGKQKPLSIDIERLDGRVEYGTLVEVMPSEEVMVVYKWSTPVALDFSKQGMLRVHWWKQSGVVEYPIKVGLRLPVVAAVKSAPPAALTSEGVYIYNTSLNKDVEATFSWE